MMNFADTRVKKYKSALLIMAIFFLGTMAWGSFHVFDYTEHDPKFCINCHIMTPAFQAWETSAHKNVECHDCHYATIWERNQMLLKTFLERPSQVSRRPHEKIIVPSTLCIKCHWAGKKDIAKISDTTGHAVHWFKGHIECTACHAIRLHKFEAEQKFCENCHQEGKKVLAGMKDLPCTECHSFRKGKLRPKSDICLTCHADKTSTPEEGRSLRHSQFTCITCHKNHQPEQPAAQSCNACHRLTLKRGLHPQHDRGGLTCLSCHKPHQWGIAKGDAKKLCSQCHKFYPLEKFS
jgi:nitrate/TMAO reductase-like tetraheme cytochrome c subunit